MKRKGIGALTAVIVALSLIAGIGVVMAGVQKFKAVPKKKAVKADGEFDTLQAPQEVAGSDLQIAEKDISDDASYPNAANVSYDLNGTDGSSHNLALGLEISSNRIDDVEIQGELDSVTNDQVRISDVYIVPDKEGNNLDASNAIVSEKVDLESEQNEFNINVPSLGAGEYVLNIELKSINTSNIGAHDDLINLDFDSTTEGDAEAFTLTIQNGA